MYYEEVDIEVVDTPRWQPFRLADIRDSGEHLCLEIRDPDLVMALKRYEIVG